MRKGFLVFFACIALVLALPACLFAQEKVTIRTLTFEGVEKDNLDKAAAQFSQDNPGVEVVIDYTSYPTTREKLVTELTAGTGRYDFLFILDDWMPEFMKNGWLEPL